MGARVIALRDVLVTQLAKELQVSTEFARVCSDAGIPVAQAKDILTWFLTRSRSERVMIIFGLLRGRWRGGGRRR